MKARRSEYDVSNQVRVSRPREVCAEIRRLYSAHFPLESFSSINSAFYDFLRLYRGEYPGYRACDTLYHDIQHTLDVTLAMTRLLDGYLSTEDNVGELGADRVRLGIICALFHDAGYIRHISDRIHKNGAEYTRTHVSRSAIFLKDYLPKIGLSDLVPAARKIVHFTGYEVALENIHLENPQDQLLGNMLGTADLIAQMSDRCYLEKCRDRLYTEFVLGGIAEQPDENGAYTIIYSSPEDLLRKTPAFFHATRKRLDGQLQGVYQYASNRNNGINLYMKGIEQNLQHLEWVISTNNFDRLGRVPPTHKPPYVEFQEDD